MSATNEATRASLPAPHEETWGGFYKRAPWLIKVRLIVLSVTGIVAAGGALALIVMILAGPRGERTEKLVLRGQELSGVAPSFTHTYELSNVSIPLVDRTKRRTAYAQFTLVLDCPNAEAKRMMELNRAKLLDVIFDVGSRFLIEDFQTPVGYDAFKGALKATYQVSFKNNAPRAIVLKDWVLN